MGNRSLHPFYAQIHDHAGKREVGATFETIEAADPILMTGSSRLLRAIGRGYFAQADADEPQLMWGRRSPELPSDTTAAYRVRRHNRIVWVVEFEVLSVAELAWIDRVRTSGYRVRVVGAGLGVRVEMLKR